MNTTYRSVYSGQEIDEAIAAMKASNGLIISNDFLGGATKAASAELAKILNDRLDDFEDPDTLRVIIDQIPDSNIFTDAHKFKLEGTNGQFKGVFPTIETRNNATAVDSIQYTGNEITLVLDNGLGASEFHRWDFLNAIWKRIKIFGLGEFDTVSMPVAGTIPTFQFSSTRFHTMKCLVSVNTPNNLQRQTQEILVSIIGGNTYISIYGDVGNASLFTASSEVVNDVVSLLITTTIPNLTVSGKQLALI